LFGGAPVAPEEAAAADARPVDKLASERDRIVAALHACAGNQSRAAEMLAIPRRTLVKRLVAYNIPRPQKRIRSGADGVDARGSRD
jgi:DNA-binding NtrC family response regulator